MNTPNAAAEICAIVITPDSYETVRPLIRAWSHQTVRANVEIVLVCPSRESLRLDESELQEFADYRVIEIGELTSNSLARSAGIRAARSPIIALTEDHCFPSPNWAEAILERHHEDWTGVGPVMVNANPDSLVSWANFLIEYGEWTDSRRGGEARHLPGHNGSYKRDALLAYGGALPDILQAESIMQWEMGAKGHRFFLEPKARSYHLNFSRLCPSIRLRFHMGRLFAANRARKWPLAQRMLYVFASPLIPVVRAFRTIRAARRSVPPRLAAIVPLITLLLAVDALGEMVGYATGAGGSMRELSDWGEFHRDRFLKEGERHLVKDSDVGGKDFADGCV